MKIGELSDQTGLSTSKIRYYEKQGLIPSPGRKTNGYRDFDSATVERLRILSLGASLGFSLSELRGLLPGKIDGALPRTAVIVALDQKLAAINEHLIQLRKKKERIGNAIKFLKEDDPNCVHPSVDHLSF